MSISDLLFPRRCLGCHQWRRYFCAPCLEKIKPLGGQICPVCQKPSISGRTHTSCQTKYTLDGLTSFFPYQGLIKQAITKLKYKFVTDLAEEFVALVNQSLKISKQNDWLFKKPGKVVLVPVPLHPRRWRQRGFNQAELLGSLLAQKLNWEVKVNLLERVKYTKPQVRLRGKERKTNVRGVFKLNHGVLRGAPRNAFFVVFDDVWTTGSTLRECGNVLKRGGAKKVWGLTVAR